AVCAFSLAVDYWIPARARPLEAGSLGRDDDRARCRLEAMPTWTIGSVTITRVEEQLGITNHACDKYFPGFEREVLRGHLTWAVPDHYSPSQDRLITSVHSWLIRAGDLTILLDTCGGNHKDRPWTPRFHQLDTPYLERLRAAGAAPEQVDMVLCTHLHADHVG